MTVSLNWIRLFASFGLRYTKVSNKLTGNSKELLSDYKQGGLSSKFKPSQKAQISDFLKRSQAKSSILRLPQAEPSQKLQSKKECRQGPPQTTI